MFEAKETRWAGALNICIKENGCILRLPLPPPLKELTKGSAALVQLKAIYIRKNHLICLMDVYRPRQDIPSLFHLTSIHMWVKHIQQLRLSHEAWGEDTWIPFTRKEVPDPFLMPA